MQRSSIECLRYCTRAVIQHLNGNKKLFYAYTQMAMQIYESERNMHSSIEEMVPEETKEKLYEMVG